MRVVVFLVLVALVSLKRYNFKGKFCAHDEHMKEQKDLGILPTKGLPNKGKLLSRRNMEQQEFEPFRVHLDTNQLVIDNPSKVNYIETYIIPKAVEWVEKLLLVRRVDSPFVVPRGGACGFVTIPTAHTQSGVDNVDTILYVGSRDVSSCSTNPDTIAYAGFFCPHQIDSSITDDYGIDSYIKVMVHEMWHAFGYSFSTFDEYRNPDLTERSELIYAGFEERGKGTPTIYSGVWKIRSEKSLEVVRDYFGCETLNGLELEDGGEDGTRKSHPESRFFFYDFMAGAISSHPVFSNLSLAVLEDSGWYRGRYENTEWMRFGEKAGCDFATQKCIIDGEVPSNFPDNHFCATDNQRRCTAQRKAVGVCVYIEYPSSLDIEFQYLSQPNVGGRELPDYCPMYEMVIMNNKLSDCLDSDNFPDNNQFFEVYGSNSACFEGTIRQNFFLEQFGGACYQYDCIKYDDNTIKGVEVTISNGDSVKCYVGEHGVEKEIDSTGVQGYIKCPAISSVCRGELGEDFTDPDEGSDSISWCFIAAVVEGTTLEKDLYVYRSLRDNYLMKSKEGRKIINLYYTYGKEISNIIEKNNFIRFFTRLPFYPLTYALKKILF